MSKPIANIIDLSNLREICNGDISREIHYLKQFNLLIPRRIDLLKNALDDKNFIAIRQEVHKMSPQAEFFGIHQVVKLKRVMEMDEQIYPDAQLVNMILHIICILQQATEEIRVILIDDFSKESE